MLETLDYTIRIGSFSTIVSVLAVCIFRFVSLLCLRSTLRLFQLSTSTLWLVQEATPPTAP